MANRNAYLSIGGVVGVVMGVVGVVGAEVTSYVSVLGVEIV